MLDLIVSVPDHCLSFYIVYLEGEREGGGGAYPLVIYWSTPIFSQTATFRRKNESAEAPVGNLMCGVLALLNLNRLRYVCIRDTCNKRQSLYPLVDTVSSACMYVQKQQMDQQLVISNSMGVWYIL